MAALALAGAAGPTPAPVSSASTSAHPAGSDEEGGRISIPERRTLNALVRRYLLGRGYKATAVALAEEVSDQDLTGRTDDSALLALSGGGRRTGGGAAATLSLLSMHRQRVAPIQALLAESEKRTEAELAGARAELRAVYEQLEATGGELSSSKARTAELEEALMHARTVRGPSGGAGAGATATTGSALGLVAHTSTAVPAPAPAAPPASALAGKITLAHAPALLRTLVDAFPALAKITVTRQRVALVPLLGHAAAAEAGTEARRSLVVSMLTLVRRPTHAERQVIKVQFGVLAGRLGGSAAEQELLPELLMLAKTGKGKERKALAAALAGTLAAHVSDKRADTLLACLADLADSHHAVVRAGVVEGLAALAATLSERWSRSLASGAAAGGGTAAEAFTSRQFASIEEAMWRVLLADKHTGAGGRVEGGEGAELVAAAEGEHALAIPFVLAMAGTPAGAAAAAAAVPSGKTGVSPPPPPALPSSWSCPPTSVLSLACATLVPTLVPWSYRLGTLFSRTLPGWLALLEDTLHTAGPGAAVVTPAPGTPVPSVSLAEWHASRAGAILRVLASSAPKLRTAVFDAGPHVTYVGPADAPQPATEGAPAPAPTDYLYELFDNAGGSSMSAFPPEIPLSSTVKGGVAVHGAGAAAPGALPAATRTALVLAALLRGTASVRRRPNMATSAATQPAGSPLWSALPDSAVVVTWPTLSWAMRTLLPSLLQQAALVNRSSSAGRAVIDGYGELLASLGVALGPSFTAFAIRPMFLRAFGIPMELPPPVSAGVPTLPGLPQPLTLALAPGPGGRTPSLTPLAQVLLGMPPAAADARKAAMAAAVGNFTFPPNYASAGRLGGDWVYVLPELAWLGRDSPLNPSHAGKSASALAALVAARAAEVAAAPPPTAPGVPVALITERLGGAWNEALLPLFGGGVLSCPALSGQRDALDHALRGLVALVAGGKGGWGGLQSALEDTLLRAGGGSSATSAPAPAPSRGGGAVVAVPAPAAAVVGAPVKAAHATGSAEDALHAAAAERAAMGASNLSHILHDILPRMAASSEPTVRVVAAGLLRSSIPLLAPSQIADPWLPAVKALAGDTAHPAVVKAAVRALATIYSTSSANDAEVRGLVNGEVTGLLSSGPKEVILEVLRALMRSVPTAPAATRDGFILDRLLEMTERVAGASEQGAEAMRDLAGALGSLQAGDVHSAAAAAVRSTRAAAIQAAAPWPGAKVEDLEEVAMALCEALRAYGSVIVSGEVKGMVREAGARLTRTDLLEGSYRDMMRGTLAALFPVEAVAGTSLGLGSPVPLHYVGGEESHASHGALGVGGVDPALLAEFAAEREGGLLPPTFDVHHGGGLDDSFGDAAKALGSSIFKGVSSLGGKGGMSSLMRGGVGLGGWGLGAGHHEEPPRAHPPAHPPTRAPEPSRGGGAQEAPVALSLSSFAAPAPAPAAGARRPSGGALEAGGSLSMSSFMSSPPPAAAAAAAATPPAGVGKGAAAGAGKAKLGFAERMRGGLANLDKMLD